MWVKKRPMADLYKQLLYRTVAYSPGCIAMHPGEIVSAVPTTDVMVDIPSPYFLEYEKNQGYANSKTIYSRIKDSVCVLNK